MKEVLINIVCGAVVLVAPVALLILCMYWGWMIEAKKCPKCKKRSHPRPIYRNGKNEYYCWLCGSLMSREIPEDQK